MANPAKSPTVAEHLRIDNPTAGFLGNVGG
jgi:hypothetical protein